MHGTSVRVLRLWPYCDHYDAQVRFSAWKLVVMTLNSCHEMDTLVRSNSAIWRINSNYNGNNNFVADKGRILEMPCYTIQQILSGLSNFHNCPPSLMLFWDFWFYDDMRMYFYMWTWRFIDPGVSVVSRNLGWRSGYEIKSLELYLCFLGFSFQVLCHDISVTLIQLL